MMEFHSSVSHPTAKPSGGHSAKSGDISGCHHWGREVHWRLLDGGQGRW